MNKDSYHMLGHTLLRVTIGLLFFIAGINKLQNPEGIIGMLGGLPLTSIAPEIFGWILILSEIVFGALIFVGYKVRNTAWPLAIILGVAWILVVIKDPATGAVTIKTLTSSNSFFHLIGIAGLVTIAWTGPGLYAINKVKVV
jgi:uncharacterized membrane protein YphA (DoxX/SURF4 family)